MAKKNILITGISGQDGIFLTSKLLENSEFNIFGISRQNENIFFEKLSSINYLDHSQVKLINLDLKNFNQVKNFINDVKPSQLYNLSGPSSVYESLENETYYRETINKIFDNLVNSCIENKVFPNFFQACSSEMFSTKNKIPLDETSHFSPRNPYSMAKFDLYQKVNIHRNNYDWKIKSGIMFNHESEFRSESFLFMKIINLVKKIKNKEIEHLELGSLELIRDWSFAGDVANAIYMINNSDFNENFVIGSGYGTSIKYVADFIFSFYGLNYKEYTKVNPSLLRDGDPKKIIANPKLLNKKLNWQPEYKIDNLISRILNKY